MYHLLKQVVEKINFDEISDTRKGELNLLIDFVQWKKDRGEVIQLNFICTHNSRRSQFSQIWAKVAADYYGVAIQSYSSGVELTELNPRAVQSLKRFGFDVNSSGGDNPHYSIDYGAAGASITAFSKLIEDPVNPTGNFAAIMTCSHADENCPIVVGCEQRISLRYDDPKAFDDTPLESSMYDYRSFQIATELFYAFSKIA
ncbi:MAG: protein-tyrosine-phosphatase [Crocinitomix sp.]|nr:protein-tyrosine-phosphatase [Crocinitomix sp.]